VLETKLDKIDKHYKEGLLKQMRSYQWCEFQIHGGRNWFQNWRGCAWISALLNTGLLNQMPHSEGLLKNLWQEPRNFVRPLPKKLKKKKDNEWEQQQTKNKERNE
jgi:hypothetical protein